MTRHDMTVTRRLFLKTTAAAGGGLMLGGFVPGLTPAAHAAGVFEPNVWVKVTADGKARIMLSMLEMGQGVMTAMPMLLAEELDVDWNNVTTEWVGADARYGNPGFGGSQTTAGSNSTRGMWKILREAGATARVMLVSAAAKDWGVAESTCTTDKGVVIHQASGRRATYASLVDKAAALPVPTNVPLKDPKAFTLLGKDVPRLDIPGKVNGAAVFGADVKLPGLLVARVVRCPVFGGKVASFNADKAKAVPGVKHVVQIASGIAVVADGYWAASNGVKALQITWDEGPLAALTSADISKKYAELAQKPGVAARKDGDFDAAFAKGAKTIERVFEAPYLAHACMEPMNCTAHVTADRCDVYLPTQSQTVTQQVAMAVSGLPQNKVFVHPTYMGGGFGRRGEGDFVADAVETSKKVGAPVKVHVEPGGRHPARLLPAGHLRPDVGGARRQWHADGMAGAHRAVVADEEAEPGLAQADGRCRSDLGRGCGEPALRHPEPEGRVHRDRSGRALRLLALGGQLRQRLRHRGVHRRNGDGRRQGPLRVPARAAGEAPPSPSPSST